MHSEPAAFAPNREGRTTTPRMTDARCIGQHAPCVRSVTQLLQQLLQFVAQLLHLRHRLVTLAHHVVMLERVLQQADESAASNLSNVSRDKWAEILEKMSPDDFKYKM